MVVRCLTPVRPFRIMLNIATFQHSLCIETNKIKTAGVKKPHNFTPPSSLHHSRPQIDNSRKKVTRNTGFAELRATSTSCKQLSRGPPKADRSFGPCFPTLVWYPWGREAKRSATLTGNKHCKQAKTQVLLIARVIATKERRVHWAVSSVAANTRLSRRQN